MFHIFQAEFFLYGEIFGLLLQDSKNYKFSQEKYTLQVVVFFLRNQQRVLREMYLYEYGNAYFQMR